MNKEAIRKTAICYWSGEDKAYVVESPLFETIAGVGTTEKESRKVFDNLLNDAYEAYLEGRVPGYKRPGRPAKGRVALNIDVKPEVKHIIQNLVNNFHCSQGEIIDFLVCSYQKQNENKEFSYANAISKTGDDKQWLSVCESVQELKYSIDHLEAELKNKSPASIRTGKPRTIQKKHAK